MTESRIKKSSRNVLVGFIGKIITMLFAFATKTLFIKILGVEYNGVSGLYTNILAVLAISELGVGNVLNYTLYSSLRRGDDERVKALVCYFRKIYLGIAVSVGVIGVALVPFLRFIIKSDLPLNELIIYYLLYLLNSVVSYFFVYKTTVITADQNNYLSNVCEIIATIIMYVAQIIYLLMSGNFLGYLIIQISCMVLKNLLLNYTANRKYPYLKHLNPKKSILPSDEKAIIVANVKATFVYKAAHVLLNNTDNILISVLVGTVYVGYYSNYYMIVTFVTAFISIFITGITASLGNLNAEQNADESYKMFNILCLIFSFIGTVVTCCMLNCYQPFINFWIGADNVMHFSWVIAIISNFYVNAIMNPVWMFRETMGLFRQVRFLILITAGLNIVFSVILGIFFGVPGVLIATLLSKLVSQYWYEPRIIFKYFNKPVKPFFLNQIKQLVITLAAAVLSFVICSFLGNTLLWIILRAVVSGIIAVAFVWLFNMKSESMEQLLKRIIIPLSNRILHRFKN
jgi:O-antigen/teichoic acid export membrane protein